MSEMVVNTSVLEKNIEKLTEAKNYYSSKKSAFGLTMFGSVSDLSSALASIQSTYQDISENIGLVESLIKDYKNDVEAVENRLSSGSGNVRDASTAGKVNKGVNSILKKTIDASNIFVSNEEINNSVSNANQTTTYENAYANYTMGDWMMVAYNPEKYSPQAAKEVGATAVVASTSVLTGLGKIIESIGDSFSWMFAMNAVGNDYIYNNGDNVEELNKTIVNPIMDKIAVDYTRELNRKFYEETEFGIKTNDLSAMKYDSKEATTITDKSEKLFGTAIATGLTMVTGGLAPAFLVGFSYGSGKSAEKHFQDTENRDFWKDSLNIGIDGAIEGFQFAAKGKMGSNLVGNAANVVKVLPAVKEVYNAAGGGLKGVGTIAKTFVNEMLHLDQIGKTEVNLIKTTLTGFGKTFIDTDVILETGAFLLDDVKSWIEVGEVTKEDVLGAVKQYGSVYWANLGANMLGAFGEAFANSSKFIFDDVDGLSRQEFNENRVFLRAMKDNPIGENQAKFFVESMQNEGQLDLLSDKQLTLLIEQDKDLIRPLMETSRMQKFVSDNITPDGIKYLTDNIFNNCYKSNIVDLFDKNNLKQNLDNISDDDFIRLLKGLVNENDYTSVGVLADSISLRERFLNMDNINIAKFVEENPGYLKNATFNSSSNWWGCNTTIYNNLVEKITDTEFLFNNPKLVEEMYDIYKELMKRNVPVSKYWAEMNDIQKVMKTNIESFSLFNESLVNGKYYDLSIDINGEKRIITVFNSEKFYDRLDNDKVLEVIKDNSLERELLNGSLKISSITLNSTKNSLIIDPSLITQTGLYEIKLAINGEERTIFRNINNFDTVDLNEIFKNSEINDAKVLGVTLSGDFNQIIDDSTKIYKVTYIKDGQQISSYLIPKYDGTLDINKLRVDKDLAGVYDFKVEKVSSVSEEMAKVKNELTFDTVFRDKKYGGNQGNVRDIVSSFIAGDEMSGINTQKAETMISIIKKYFPNATDLDLKNIATRYTKSGCGYMAVSNDLVEYMLRTDNGLELFESNFGYSLLTKQGGFIDTNQECLALEMFLYTTCKKNTILEPQDIVLRGKGCTAKEYTEIFKDFFNEHGIKYEAEQILATSNRDLATFVLNNHDAAFDVVASGFDLELLSTNDWYDMKLNQVNDPTYDQSLVNAFLNQKLLKNVGGHAMVLTGFDEDLNPIVSSWGEKCKYFKSDSKGFVHGFAIKFNLY